MEQLKDNFVAVLAKIQGMLRDEKVTTQEIDSFIAGAALMIGGETDEPEVEETEDKFKEIKDE